MYFSTLAQRGKIERFGLSIAKFVAYVFCLYSIEMVMSVQLSVTIIESYMATLNVVG